MASPDILYENRLKLETTAAYLRLEFLKIATGLDVHKESYVRVRNTATRVAATVTSMALGSFFLTMGMSSLVFAVSGVAVAATFFVVAYYIYKHILEKDDLEKVETMWATFCSLYEKMYMEGVDQGSTPDAERKMEEIRARLAESAARGMSVQNLVIFGLTVYEIIQDSLENNSQGQSRAGDIFRSLANELEKIIEISKQGNTKEKQEFEQNVPTFEHKMHTSGFIQRGSEHQQQCTQVERNSDKKEVMDEIEKYQKEIILTEISIIVP